MNADRIQGRGALLAFRAGGPIVAASENAGEVFGADPLGSDPSAVLGRDGLHAVRNIASIPLSSERSMFAARTDGLDLHSHVTGNVIVVEAEPAPEDPLPDPYEIERDVALILGADGYDRRADLIRTLSGFQNVSLSGADGSSPDSGTTADMLVIDDFSRPPVRVLGEVPYLGRAWLRCPAAETNLQLRQEKAAAAVVVRWNGGLLKMTHSRPRLPNHKTRLVLLHLLQVLWADRSGAGRTRLDEG